LDNKLQGGSNMTGKICM